MGLIQTGQPLTPALLNVVAAYKAADTSRTTATITADPDLAVPVIANAVYLVDFSAAWNANASGDVQWNFTVPAGATFNNYRHTSNDGSVTATSDVAATASTVQARSGTGVNYILDIKGTLVVGATAGTFAFCWAENTVFATPTIFRAGSYMRLQRIV